MSEWTNIEGSHTSQKASIKRIIDEVLGGEDVVGFYQHREFSVRFEHGGIRAAKSIQKIIETFKEFDKSANISLVATIPFSA